MINQGYDYCARCQVFYLHNTDPTNTLNGSCPAASVGPAPMYNANGATGTLELYLPVSCRIAAGFGLLPQWNEAGRRHRGLRSPLPDGDPLRPRAARLRQQHHHRVSGEQCDDRYVPIYSPKGVAVGHLRCGCGPCRDERWLQRRMCNNPIDPGALYQVTVVQAYTAQSTFLDPSPIDPNSSCGASGPIAAGTQFQLQAHGTAIREGGSCLIVQSDVVGSVGGVAIEGPPTMTFVANILTSSPYFLTAGGPT